MNGEERGVVVEEDMKLVIDDDVKVMIPDGDEMVKKASSRTQGVSRR